MRAAARLRARRPRQPLAQLTIGLDTARPARFDVAGARSLGGRAETRRGASRRRNGVGARAGLRALAALGAARGPRLPLRPLARLRTGGRRRALGGATRQRAIAVGAAHHRPLLGLNGFRFAALARAVFLPRCVRARARILCCTRLLSASNKEVSVFVEL